MKLEDIQAAWAEDCRYDPDDVPGELARLPILHQKYMDMLVAYRAKKKNLAQRLDRTRREKLDHYKGRTDNPHPIRLTAGETDAYVKSDPDFQTPDAQLEMADIAVDYIERIIKVLTSRSYDLRAILEYNKFVSGR